MASKPSNKASAIKKKAALGTIVRAEGAKCGRMKKELLFVI